jgi:CDP-diacylglycerol--glycerol-3-phosphate 3-phosphatidyltransferase
VVNAITVYRLIAALILLLLIVNNQVKSFSILLCISFFTDAIDGYLARKYDVKSLLGAKLDSVADDFTIAAAIIAVIAFEPNFLWDQSIFVFILLILYILQLAISLIKYHKISSFHTYLAKVAAVLQAVFLILFFLIGPIYPLFYIMFFVTALDLIEEIVLAYILPKWETNIKGLYWVIKRNRTD